MKGYRSLTRALALSCAAVALTPGVAPAASPDTPPCPHGTRAATGMAGTCTTSSPNDVDAVAAALVVILSGAGAFAIVRDVRRPAGRRRRGPSTEAALAERA